MIRTVYVTFSASRLTIDTVTENSDTDDALLQADDPLTSTVVLPEDTPVGEDVLADGRVQVGSVLRDRFLLQERVMGGGMGVVYKALDRRLAESGDAAPWVAIKVLSPQFAANGHALRALQQEAAKGRCLTHPNIVRFIDFDRDDDLYFIVMEWLDGRTLADILDSADAASVDSERAFRIVRQVGNALDYAHRCGIVHADVKPANIMILPNGDAKLFDFGVARVRQKALEQQPDFDPGILGLLTPAYSSMQVLTGETPVPEDDVFSLACLLYRLLAGYRVFGPRNAAEAAQEGMEPQPLSHVSEAHWRAIKKALSYSRVTRFGSMAEFVAALETEVSEPITISVPARDESEPQEQSSRALPWLLLVVALLGAAGVAEWRYGAVETLRQRIAGMLAPEQRPERPAEQVLPAPEETVTAEQPEIAESGSEEAPEESPSLEDEAELELPDAVEVVDLVPRPEVEQPAEFTTALIDFSTLPPPTAELRLASPGQLAATTSVRLREDGNPVTIDLIRTDSRFPLTLKVEEISFTGNRSPWGSEQFTFSDNGFVEFPVGQDRARLVLEMTADPIREADQQSSLRVREADSSDSELGIINVMLEDDDQRRFEATLPANTIGFATSQVSVREQDPAVQIDILRFNPDNTSMAVAYSIRDITATQGEDYFAPSGFTIDFGPGQRSARLLIPLVQDTEYEDNEAFSVELSGSETLPGSDIYFRTAVMIRDDDD